MPAGPRLPLCRLLLAGALLATLGCSAPSGRQGAPPPEPVRSLNDRLARAAAELLNDVGSDVVVAFSMRWDDGFTDDLRDALRAGLVTGLREHCRVLAEPEDLALARRYEPSHARRLGATHFVRAHAAPSASGWRVSWRLLDVETGEALGAVDQAFSSLELPVPAEQTATPVEAGDPVALTQKILAAGRDNQPAIIVAALHPELRKAWGRRARSRGITLEEFVARYFSSATLKALGRVTKIDPKPGRIRTEVEVSFAKKYRDVDFTYRAVGSGWLLASVEDYP